MKLVKIHSVQDPDMLLRGEIVFVDDTGYIWSAAKFRSKVKEESNEID